MNQLITNTTQFTKTEISKIANDFVNKINEGHDKPLDIAIQLNYLEGLVKETKEKLKETINEELAKYSEKEITVLGAKIVKCAVKTEYDYSNNAEWVKLNEAAEKAIAARKALEEQLKKIPEGKSLVNEETGEITAAPIKLQTEGYKITLAK